MLDFTHNSDNDVNNDNVDNEDAITCIDNNYDNDKSENDDSRLSI